MGIVFCGDMGLSSGPSSQGEDFPSDVVLHQHVKRARDRFSPTLTRLHRTLGELFKQREQLETDLQLKYGEHTPLDVMSQRAPVIDAPSLTLRASPAQGMHVHLGKAKRDQTRLNGASEFVSIAESASTRCYFHKVHFSYKSCISIVTTKALTGMVTTWRTNCGNYYSSCCRGESGFRHA